MKRNEITNTLYEAIQELNDTLGYNLLKSEDTVLFGKGSSLDSMGLVSLIVTAERLIEEQSGITLTLANEKAFSRSSSPFKTIATLADYIDELLKEEK